MALETAMRKTRRITTIPGHILMALVVGGALAVFFGPGAVIVAAPLYYIAKRKGML